MPSEDPISFIDRLKAEIAEREDKLARNPNYIELQALKRSLEALEPHQSGGRAAKRPSCTCGAAFSTHPVKTVDGIEKRFCPRTNFTREYSPAVKS